MPQILSIGSLNIDYVYQVAEFVRPGETLATKSFSKNPGGKGLNQSIAAARAGAKVTHIGRIGPEGIFLKDLLDTDGVDTSQIQTNTSPTGHAIIQVDATGENCILLYPGANAELELESIREAIQSAAPDTLVLLQNETNGLPEILNWAAEANLRVVFNPAPYTQSIQEYPLDAITVLICNETEGAALSSKTTPQAILKTLQEQYPETSIILTLGAKGCCGLGPNTDFHIPAAKVEAIDTTAAGDTFVGYLTAAIAQGQSLETAARLATKAAAITVTRSGAAESIPYLKEVI